MSVIFILGLYGLMPSTINTQTERKMLVRVKKYAEIFGFSVFFTYLCNKPYVLRLEKYNLTVIF